jgi:hypothetical protein
MTVELTSSDVRVTLEGTEAQSNLTVVRAPVTVEVVNATPGGGGVTDHGALTGLADDDHKQYQRADSVFTATSPYTITDESFVVTTGAAITLPDAATNVGRMVSIGSAGSDVVVSAAGTDTIHGAGASFTVPLANGVTFASINIGGSWGWAVTNLRGPAYDLPSWYGLGIADGNAITLASGVPTWTTGTRTSHEFLSGTGWTYDVPVFVPVKNTSGSTIAKGTPVYATGTVGATSTIEIAPADADDAAKMPAIGLTETSLTANATGFVVVVGTLRGVNTNTYSINAPLYVSTTAGQLTGTKPTGTSELIQNIGRVTRVNSNNGEILVLGPGRTNDVPNAIDAGKITSGTLATARLGSGTANAGTFLRGDQTYARPVVSAYYVTGRYYPTPGVTSGGTRALASGAASATPYPIYQPVSVDGLQIDLSAATGSGQSIDLHVMTANASGDPDTSVFTVNVTTTGSGTQVLSATTTAVALTPGLYYVVAHNRSANALTARTVAAACHVPPIPSNTASSANQFSGWLKTPGTGAITSYPAVTAVTDNVNQSPIVSMRFA